MENTHIDNSTSEMQHLLDELFHTSVQKAPLRIPAGIDMRLPLKRGRNAVWENQHIRAQNERRKPFGDFDHRFRDAATRRMNAETAALEWYADTYGSAEGSSNPEDAIIDAIDRAREANAEVDETLDEFDSEEMDDVCEQDDFLEMAAYWEMRRTDFADAAEEYPLPRVLSRKTQHVSYAKPHPGDFARIYEEVRDHLRDWPLHICFRVTEQELRQRCHRITWTETYVPEHPVPEVRDTEEREETRRLQRERRAARYEHCSWDSWMKSSYRNQGRKPRANHCRVSLRFACADVANGRCIQRMIAQAEIEDGNVGARLLLREIIADIRAERAAQRRPAMNVAA